MTHDREIFFFLAPREKESPHLGRSGSHKELSENGNSLELWVTDQVPDTRQRHQTFHSSPVQVSKPSSQLAAFVTSMTETKT